MTMPDCLLILALSDALAGPLTSAEIVPGGYEQWAATGITEQFPFLLSDGHLGVPKKIMYKLYISATRLFIETKRSKERTSERTRHLIASTSVILLANSAHQTALNTRKALLHLGILEVASELTMFAAIMSGCRESAKASTLWHHRRWMIHSATSGLDTTQRSYDRGYIQTRVSLETLHAEFELLSRCCESYPRNYYAWAHRAYCMGLLYQLRANGAPGSESLVETEFASLLKWIDLHPSDYTAMDYISKFVSQFRGGEINFCVLFKHALSMILAYPGHEALWMYVRSILCSVPLEERDQWITQIKAGPLGDSNEIEKLGKYLNLIR